MRIFSVKIPIAGHALVEVTAETEDEAISIAFDTVERTHIEEWEALKQFNKGNVCVVKENQETHTSDAMGDRRHLTPRRGGNLSGLAYAAAILAILKNPGDR